MKNIRFKCQTEIIQSSSNGGATYFELKHNPQIRGYDATRYFLSGNILAIYTPLLNGGSELSIYLISETGCINTYEKISTLYSKSYSYTLSENLRVKEVKMFVAILQNVVKELSYER